LAGSGDDNTLISGGARRSFIHLILLRDHAYKRVFFPRPRHLAQYPRGTKFYLFNFAPRPR
jgi:hypothetical protein